MPKRLPSNIFSDNPLRPTDDGSAAAPILAPNDQTAQEPTQEASSQAVDSRSHLKAVPATTAKAEVRKLTVYLPVESFQAIDDEVYLRRKNGERGLSFADLHREIVEDWVARRRRRAANPG
jgi:hypothetical protein